MAAIENKSRGVTVDNMELSHYQRYAQNQAFLEEVKSSLPSPSKEGHRPLSDFGVSWISPSRSHLHDLPICQTEPTTWAAIDLRRITQATLTFFNPHSLGGRIQQAWKRLSITEGNPEYSITDKRKLNALFGVLNQVVADVNIIRANMARFQKP